MAGALDVARSASPFEPTARPLALPPPRAYISVVDTLRSPRVRRIVALLLLWAFAFAGLEAPIADVHDGDATHAEVDRATGERHSGHESAGRGSSPSGPESSDHPVHVCHCVHAHTGVLAAPSVELRTVERTVHITALTVLAPFAVALTPPTHPPTA